VDWLFQCNPKRFDLATFLEGESVVDRWAMNQGKDLVSVGDRVFFWQTGEEARLLAIGHVISPVYERESSFGSHVVDIAFEHKVVPPLTRDEARANETLRNFTPFRSWQGTNFLIRDSSIVAELERNIEGRLVPISGQPPVSPPPPVELDAAIKTDEREKTNALRNYIAAMDPTAFEWLVRALFLKLGYANVEVTKRSGDGGVDVRAVLAAAGVGRIKTCIQVKRQQNVGRPVVQNVRGSLGAHEVGIVVTSGGFSDEARAEAQDQTKAPITLIDGRELTKLLLKHQIGIQHVNVRLYRLVLDNLVKEKLQTLVEESEESES